MGIEPTWERLHAPTPDLKSGSPTSELGASKVGNIYCCKEFGNLPLRGIAATIADSLPVRRNHAKNSAPAEVSRMAAT